MRTLLLLYCLANTNAFAQPLSAPFAERYLLLEGMVPAFTSAACFSMQPASLAALEKPALSLAAERRFFLKDAGGYRFGAGIPTRYGNVGVGFATGGSVFWQERSLSAAYARHLGAGAAVGIRFQYISLGAPAYGKATALLASAGLRLQLLPGLQAALSVENPGRTTIGKNQSEKLPALFGLGLAWNSADQWLLGAWLQKQDGQRPALLAGLTYLFSNRLLARAGVDTGLPGCYIGAGLRYAGMALSLTVMLHRELGSTPAISLTYPSK